MDWVSVIFMVVVYFSEISEREERGERSVRDI